MKQIQIEDARSSAQVMAEQASIGIQFNDIETLTEITGTVRWKNSLRSAIIVSRDFEILASFPPEADKLPHLDHLLECLQPNQKEGYHHEPFFIQPLIGSEGIEGFLGFQLNNDVLNNTLIDQFKALFLTLLMVPFVVSLLIRPWREALIRPIAELSSVSSKILKNYDFSLRANSEREDELGKMVTSFNRMMGMIQERDRLLLKSKDLLSDKVDERTLLLNALNQKLQTELEHRQVISDRLLVAKEKAEASDIAKSEFLSVISHEVRTPISGIFGMVQLLQKTNLDENQKEYLQQISSASTRQLRLINNILDLTKMEVGEFQIQKEHIELRRIIEDTAREQAAVISKKGLDFLIDYSPESPNEVIADGHAIQQILANLIGNSTKFTEKGSIIIKVCFEPSQKSHEMNLMITVQDSGIGIEQDKMENLFGKFTQADSSTSRNYGGTGLGLAICKHLSEMMGGSIQGRSEPGQGTFFSVEVPVEVKNPKQEVIQIQDGRRVWLITPSKEVERITKRRLESLGIEVLLNKKDFFKSRDSRDVVMLDLHHNLDQKTLVEELKELQVLGDIKVVFLTGYFSEGQHPFITDFKNHQTLRRPLIQLKPLLKIFDINLPENPSPLDPPSKSTKFISTIEHDDDSPLKFDLNILLVEDDEVNQIFMSTMIKEHTGDYTLAENGKVAIDLLEGGLDVDLILMDCMMPQMDGYQATEWIRKSNTKAKNIPIYALTANQSAKDRKRCLDSGMNGIFSKPLLEEDFLGFLEKHA